MKIKKGSTQKANIKIIQKALGIKADGIFGPKTHIAVSKKQYELGLEITGIVDDVLFARLTTQEPDRPSNNEPGKKTLWIPFAHIPPNMSMVEKGEYDSGYPTGAVIHFSAGRWEKGLSSAVDTISWGLKQGYNFLCIAFTGELVQASPLNKWGLHAGESSYPGLGTSVSRKLVGIEHSNSGKLEKQSDGRFKTWFGTFIDPTDVRTVEKKENMHAGSYQKFSDAQFETLVNTLMYLKSQAPNIFNFDYVLGHDEVAPGRKNDPGGAFPMTMPEFREYLKAEYAKRTKG